MRLWTRLEADVQRPVALPTKRCALHLAASAPPSVSRVRIPPNFRLLLRLLL